MLRKGLIKVLDKLDEHFEVAFVLNFQEYGADKIVEDLVGNILLVVL
jgi:hypothetical protein